MTEQKLNHGGDWAGFVLEYGKTPLDFSMNVNPLGMNKAVAEAVAAAAAEADRYPDPLCRQLVQRLSETEGIPPEQIFCGNGAADIIFRLADALKEDRAGAATAKAAGGDGPRLLVTAPSFSEYETAFSARGWEVDYYLLQPEKGFAIGEDILDRITEATGAAFLCEPNNPTGLTTPPQLLQKILQQCKQTDTWLIVDECFNGFLEEPDGHSLKPALKECGNLILLKAFTKLYGMAGIRLGYCLTAEARLPESLRRCGPPWNVSSLAQAAGIAALSQKEYVAEGRRIVAEERVWLKEELQAAGVKVVFGEANYLLFQSRVGLAEEMRGQGILIRDCGNYTGLTDGWYRIAVRTHEENQELMKALRKELK